MKKTALFMCACQLIDINFHCLTRNTSHFTDVWWNQTRDTKTIHFERVVSAFSIHTSIQNEQLKTDDQWDASTKQKLWEERKKKRNLCKFCNRIKTKINLCYLLNTSLTYWPLISTIWFLIFSAFSYGLSKRIIDGGKKREKNNIRVLKTDVFVFVVLETVSHYWQSS